MERAAADVDAVHLGLLNFDAFIVGAGASLAVDVYTDLLCGGGGVTSTTVARPGSSLLRD
jgi:hypothetical protein